MSEKRIAIRFDTNSSDTVAALLNLHSAVNTVKQDASTLKSASAQLPTSANLSANATTKSRIPSASAAANSLAATEAKMKSLLMTLNPGIVGAIGRVTSSFGDATRASKAFGNDDHLKPLWAGLRSIAEETDRVASNLFRCDAAINRLTNKQATIEGITSSFKGIADAANSANAAAGKVATSTAQVGSSAPAVNTAAQAVGTLASNATKAAQATGTMGQSAAQAAPKQQSLNNAVAQGTQRFGNMYLPINQNVSAMEKLNYQADGLMKALGSFAARIAVFEGLKTAIGGVGEAIADARQKAEAGATANLDLRDNYRELANLQHKATPDDRMMASIFAYRKATGASEEEANNALKQFEGAIPAALEAGNIKGTSTSGVAGEFFRSASRMATRVQLNPEEAALLAAKIAQTRKVDSSDSGMAEFGAVVDVLNDGLGNMTPLVRSMIRHNGAFVGSRSIFKSNAEWAAAQSVATLANSPAVSGSAVQRAARATSRFDERAGPNGAPQAGDALAEAGITPDDDFATRVEKLAKLTANDKDVIDSLSRRGFKNSAERRDLAQQILNSKLLRAKTDRARRGANLTDIEEKNRQFYADAVAQRRTNRARNDEARFNQFRESEGVESRKIGAEATLRRSGQLDDQDTTVADAWADNAIPRLWGAWTGKVSEVVDGHKFQSDRLPIFLGGKPQKQLRIESQALYEAEQEAASLGIDPATVPSVRDTSVTERTARLAEEIRRVRQRGAEKREPIDEHGAKPTVRPVAFRDDGPISTSDLLFRGESPGRSDLVYRGERADVVQSSLAHQSEMVRLLGRIAQDGSNPIVPSWYRRGVDS